MMWRRIDSPGHEWARLSGSGSSPVLRGTAVFMEAHILGRLDYRILCNSRWETLGAEVLGWVGDEKVKLRIAKTRDNAWSINDLSAPQAKGCLDIDLSFSPSTNLLPIRRLNLEIGQEAEVRAAWLKFPDMTLHPLLQRFRRISEHRYFYDSEIGFSTELEVNAEGFVVDYPPLWTEETGE
jgi:hypothetical protein